MVCSIDEKAERPSTPPTADGSDSPTMNEERQMSADDRRRESVIDQDIQQLARSYTSNSHRPSRMFPVPDDGPLDPNSPKFNARKWATSFYNLRSEQSDAPLRTSGVAFRGLNVHGFGTPTDFQKSVGNVLDARTIVQNLTGSHKQRIEILHNLEGVVNAGEMLMTIAGETHGFHVDESATLNYQGIRPEQMRTTFHGEAIYTAEVDDHFPQMTVGDTLYFAAAARAPKKIPADTTRREYAEYLRDVTMTMFGISHTKNTRVGNDFVRGVSGGERKRTTIAEAALSYSPLQCWDNSTRGLDSANALEFCRTLRIQADVMKTTALVAIYQASQDAYEVFDKVVLLYEGRQIFFGRTGEAKTYFEELGFICPNQQTTADFLTSMTSHQERFIRPGFEGKTPCTPDEFAAAWRRSTYRERLGRELDTYLEAHPFDSQHYDAFLASRRHDQSASQRGKSPFTLSYWSQVKITLWRSWLLTRGAPDNTIAMFVMTLFQALIISSIFYNMPATSDSISRRGILIFFIMLTNAFASILEIMTLYAKRRVVEKHARYALYHPSAEALSAILCDLPYKILNTIISNIVIYFMTNMRREAGPFFFFLLNIFMVILTMSMMFRLLGSLTKTIASALAPASVILLVVMLYTGYAIKVQNMQVWLGWLRWVNPVHYGFEALMLNEFVGRTFDCTSYVPSGPAYDSVSADQRVCSVAGARPGEDFIDGAVYLEQSYGYVNSNKWRDFGIMIVFMLTFLSVHLVASEYVASERSKGEVLVFKRDALKRNNALIGGPGSSADVEAQAVGQTATVEKPADGSAANIRAQTSIFHWSNVCYDVKVKGETRRILDHVDGWVKPGTLTALMGVSGAGKTTLLDVLASRVTMGVIDGQMLVDGKMRGQSFQRQTGYVTQQDLHLYTSTVKEALVFSALLRQPDKYSHEEKIAYVDEVITLLDMADYADAIIGTLGEGLNVEQRKRLTIGVELAARPDLLLFLDEPTSGLDSQTSWSICNLMEKLTNSGQAILCTIHQPSAVLFQRFDRLLLLAKGGKTVYFGEIGKDSHILIDYFVRNGAMSLPNKANPAEYMLEVIGAAPGATTTIDWPDVWRKSPEYQGVQEELGRLSSGGTAREAQVSAPPSNDDATFTDFAAPFSLQLKQVTKRVFQQYWRSPSYIYSKGFLSVGAALFIGLSFLMASNTQSGLQNQMFGVFIFLTVFSQLVDQIMPVFVSQRTLYEARERPAKAYSWVAFIMANMVVEMFWNSIMCVLSFVLWYYPMGLYRNAEEAGQLHERGALIFLLIWVFFLFTTSFAFLAIAGIEDAEMAGGIVGLLTIMMFTFCGVVAGPGNMPGFWIFMYRVNPFTYFVESFLGAALANAKATCASNEWLTFNAPNGSTCGDYLESYLTIAPGFLEEDSSNGHCRYCQVGDTNSFLAGVNINYDNRWRDFGLMWVFTIFNLAIAILIFWLTRVPKIRKTKTV